MNKKVVGDLFGGLNGSVGLAIGYEDYDIYTIDVLSHTKDGRPNIKMNLATDNIEELLVGLSALPKPDIIVASPMCKAFSNATALKGGGNLFFKNDNGYLRERNDNIGFENHRQYYSAGSKEHIETRTLGVNALKNTLAIIDKFEPTYGYIENPNGSHMGRYIDNNLKGERERETKLSMGIMVSKQRREQSSYQTSNLSLTMLKERIMGKLFHTKQEMKTKVIFLNLYFKPYLRSLNNAT